MPPALDRVEDAADPPFRCRKAYPNSTKITRNERDRADVGRRPGDERARPPRPRGRRRPEGLAPAKTRPDFPQAASDSGSTPSRTSAPSSSRSSRRSSRGRSSSTASCRARIVSGSAGREQPGGERLLAGPGPRGAEAFEERAPAEEVEVGRVGVFGVEEPLARLSRPRPGAVEPLQAPLVKLGRARGPVGSRSGAVRGRRSRPERPRTARATRPTRSTRACNASASTTSPTDEDDQAGVGRPEFESGLPTHQGAAGLQAAGVFGLGRVRQRGHDTPPALSPARVLGVKGKGGSDSTWFFPGAAAIGSRRRETRPAILTTVAPRISRPCSFREGGTPTEVGEGQRPGDRTKGGDPFVFGDRVGKVESLDTLGPSPHSGSVNSLFADGHVASVKDGVSLPVWRALGTRNGNEIVPS